MKTLNCSIGVMAFNEESNIRFVLESLLNQRLLSCRIVEIVVVASGCTDRTVDIVKKIEMTNSRVRLLIQENREGKASAINLFLSTVQADVVVIESGDTIPLEDTIENLIKPFYDADIGMTGAHPVPVNSKETFMGFTAHLFWDLHHRMAQTHPKLGEMIAFRNIIKEIPSNTAVDEASIEAAITKAGFRTHYSENAIVRNKGPETIGDFFKQRRRIIAGHKHLRKSQGYAVSTMKVRNLLELIKPLVKEMPRDLRSVLWTFGAVSTELLGRMLGVYDYYIKNKTPYVWDTAKSTKKLKNVSSYT